MTIKPLPQSIPTKLPPAKLYLDDIAEIVQILTDSRGDCQASFVAGRSKCDTVDDLKELGGRLTHFVLDISSPGKHQTLEIATSSTRIHIHEIGDQLAAWSKYVNVAAIFEKRKLRLKSAVHAARWPIFAALWFLTVAFGMSVRYAVKPVSIYQVSYLGTGILLAAAVVYYFVSSQSIVYLRYPHKVGLGRWLEEHKPEIIVGVMCSLAGGIASQIVGKVWK